MPQDYTKYQDTIIDPKIQERLNEPLSAEQLDKTHEGYLKILLSKIQSGELDTLTPATLYNHAVYDKLNDADKEKADLTAINLMSIIRQIRQLWQLDQKDTFQIQNLVETVFQMKSHFEELHGDVYII